MAYLIYDIKTFSPEEYPYYFLDSNVWIAALKYYGVGNTNAYEIPYQGFFDAIVNLNEINDPKAEKHIKNKPKIVLTSLVLSEIINAFMRNVAMKAYFDKLGFNHRNYVFKNDYRDNSNSDYKSQLSNLCSDIVALSDYTLLMNDSFDIIDPFSFLPNLVNIDQDFNDLYYYHFLRENKIPFVSHDKDCKFEDIVIITASKELLRISNV
jgi:hypothetical protein